MIGTLTAAAGKHRDAGLEAALVALPGPAPVVGVPVPPVLESVPPVALSATPRSPLQDASAIDPERRRSNLRDIARTISVLSRAVPRAGQGARLLRPPR